MAVDMKYAIVCSRCGTATEIWMDNGICRDCHEVEHDYPLMRDIMAANPNVDWSRVDWVREKIMKKGGHHG